MALSIAHEMIVLPVAAKNFIRISLMGAGIRVNYEPDLPPKFKGSGTMFSCQENKGRAQILIIEDLRMEQQFPGMLPVLILPGRSTLADWFCGTTDSTLREKIHSLLHDLKDQIASSSPGTP